MMGLSKGVGKWEGEKNMKSIYNDNYLPMYSKNTMAAKHNPVKSMENRECDIENIQFVWKFGSSLYIKNSMFQCFPG